MPMIQDGDLQIIQAATSKMDREVGAELRTPRMAELIKEDWAGRVDAHRRNRLRTQVEQDRPSDDTDH